MIGGLPADNAWRIENGRPQNQVQKVRIVSQQEICLQHHGQRPHTGMYVCMRYDLKKYPPEYMYERLKKTKSALDMEF